MIQRIQSLYLFFTAIFYLNYWYFGMEWFEKGFLILSDIFAHVDGKEGIFFIISYIPLFIAIVCLISILLFRNRVLQCKFVIQAFRVSLFMCLFTVFYFYNTLEALTDMMPSKILEFFLYAAILNPFICSFLIYKALNFIKKDDELISSLNRIR